MTFLEQARAGIKVLDHGYIKLIHSMGNDEDVIEAARMSTGKGFFGWFWEKDTYADVVCTKCITQHLSETLSFSEEDAGLVCPNCWTPGIMFIGHLDPAMPEELTKPKLLGKAGERRDISLLEFLYMHRHMTPFEMGELCIEVKAPIMVFREWHRHRTQSYNEFSARYAQMPNEHYVPALDRIQKQSTANKQGSGAGFEMEFQRETRSDLMNEQETVYQNYDRLVRKGVAKEVARINTPVSRYSKMRAKTDLRNWLGFLMLRMENSAQWEIRQFANIIAQIIQAIWPKTYDLFLEHDFFGVRFSRTEMRVLQHFFASVSNLTAVDVRELMAIAGPGETMASVLIKEAGDRYCMDKKQVSNLKTKLLSNKENLYPHLVKHV